MLGYGIDKIGYIYIQISFTFFEEKMRECFTDHTLAHPLNCRGGVVARLSA